MDIISAPRLQLQHDTETDAARLGRIEWHRALAADLHALRDYVHPCQLIIWQPGIIKRRGHTETEPGALQVELTTGDTCTCHRYRLRARCEHVTFARALDHAGLSVDTITPVTARSLEVTR